MELQERGTIFCHYLPHGGGGVAVSIMNTLDAGADNFGIGESKYLNLVTSYKIIFPIYALNLGLAPYPRDHGHGTYGSELIIKHWTKINLCILYISKVTYGELWVGM